MGIFAIFRALRGVLSLVVLVDAMPQLNHHGSSRAVSAQTESGFNLLFGQGV
jgi:hypothetical protein